VHPISGQNVQKFGRGRKWRAGRLNQAGEPVGLGLLRHPPFPSSTLSGLCNPGRSLYCFQINVEERLPLVAFIRILLTHANHFPKNLDVEAIALRFKKDFLLSFSEFLDFALDVLDALDNSSQIAAAH
jgi:hypothetical protein